jgi:hypothetical protein
MITKTWFKLIVSILTIATTFEIKSAHSQSQETEQKIYIAKNTQKITEAKVRQILQDFINSSKSQDLEKYMKLVAKNCKLESSIKTEAGEFNSVTLNREQLQAVMQQGFSNVDTYKGSINNLKIKISPDGRSATANYNLLEEIITSNGYIISTTSSESTKFETIDGQILMTYRKTVGRFNY